MRYSNKEVLVIVDEVRERESFTDDTGTRYTYVPHRRGYRCCESRMNDLTIVTVPVSQLPHKDKFILCLKMMSRRVIFLYGDHPDFDCRECMSWLQPCGKAPTGWYCTRMHGHRGPCAAKRRVWWERLFRWRV